MDRCFRAYSLSYHSMWVNLNTRRPELRTARDTTPPRVPQSHRPLQQCWPQIWIRPYANLEADNEDEKGIPWELTSHVSVSLSKCCLRSACTAVRKTSNDRSGSSSWRIGSGGDENTKG
ncbi:hypothetical protein BLNAU_10602 [Blattamonas nauphoetae]|uniref:Uncharacterized protein n=1 Tax=Blattamonas nauphoetae TaxID=2049346 RepID=A0ABQ9XHX1_9EUKA|nr:hypothetical protein BLNAU_18745 [Blattamonas nauphoetae]KAK2949780.1 hypothetical protein BLNAU_15262 [Blattamonas nauphoetae]KAK2951718.1 hypothetical protein BLNAU_13330 [Blattamonas nauphoetae]KAK2954434.1 hypothetical protein BLNAU_10602 [Blattamonas nauphoetae]